MTFYTDNAEAYFSATVDLPVGSFHKSMLKKLTLGSKILDIGCGSGRDSYFFSHEGLNVTAIDGSEKLVNLANERFDIDAKVCSYNEFHSEYEFDAYWALASLVHLREDLFVETVKHLSQYLKSGGVFYISLKPQSEHGVDSKKALFFQGWSVDLFYKVFSTKFTDLFEDNFEIKMTDDVGGRDFEWLNIWLTKK